MSSRVYLNIQDYREIETIAPTHIHLTRCVSREVQAKLWDFGPCPTVLEIKKSRIDGNLEQMKQTIHALRVCFDTILHHLHIEAKSSATNETPQLVWSDCVSPEILVHAQNYSDQLVRAERQV